MSQFRPHADQRPPLPMPRTKEARPRAWLAIIIGVVALWVLGGAIAFWNDVVSVPFRQAALEEKDEQELAQLGELALGLRSLAAEPKFGDSLRDPQFAGLKGATFWTVSIHKGVLDELLSKRLVSPHADTGVHMGPVVASGAVSYTAPKAAALQLLLTRQGSSRAVLVTWNSRNWRNAGGGRVPIAWSDRDVPEWLTYEQASANYGITAEEWADPAGKLFGKKAPFEFTYE